MLQYQPCLRRDVITKKSSYHKFQPWQPNKKKCVDCWSMATQNIWLSMFYGTNLLAFGGLVSWLPTHCVSISSGRSLVTRFTLQNIASMSGGGSRSLVTSHFFNLPESRNIFNTVQHALPLIESFSRPKPTLFHIMAVGGSMAHGPSQGAKVLLH